MLGNIEHCIRFQHCPDFIAKHSDLNVATSERIEHVRASMIDMFIREPGQQYELCGILGDEAIRRRGLPALG